MLIVYMETIFCPDSFKDRLVGHCKTIFCKRCKKTYQPTDNEITTKNPSVYYKTCFDCRKKSNIYYKKYFEKKLENKILL